jgi:hypothetical protein
MNIRIESEEELEDKFKKAAHILNNLRYWTAKYEETLGSELKAIKKRWEGKADEFLKELDIPLTKEKTQIKIIKK